MALREHQDKVTPHDKKVKRFNAAKAHAKELLLALWPTISSSVVQRLNNTPPQNDESERAMRVEIYRKAAENCFLMAEAFTQISKNLKGKYLQD